MTYQNINSRAIAPNATGQGASIPGVLEAEIPKSVTRPIVGDCREDSSFYVDPLAYYVALVLVSGMDELLTGGGYCQVDGRRYCSLEGVIRAILGKDFVIERGESVKRKRYPRYHLREGISGGRGRPRKLPSLDKMLELYKIHTLKEIGDMYGVHLEAVRKHLVGTGAMEQKKAARLNQMVQQARELTRLETERNGAG